MKKREEKEGRLMKAFFYNLFVALQPTFNKQEGLAQVQAEE